MENTNEVGLAISVAKLVFESKTPSLEDCWREGFEMSSKLDLNDNPYKARTSMSRHWAEGWWAGVESSPINTKKAASNESIYNEIKEQTATINDSSIKNFKTI